jgi:hypothetical protein
MARTRNAPPPRKHLRIAALVVALVVFVTVLILGSRSVVQAECELCVTFHGVTTCRQGSGATPQEAERAAQKAACAVMANGMNDVIACENTPPTNLQCRT